MIFRPATPGFLVTLVATILLAVVSFSVPWFKSIFFLKALVDFNGTKGTATFGVLGYCLDTGSGNTCTSPRIGYEFDPNALLGNKLPVQIPQVVVKWLTYALVLHIVALAFSAVSAVFGLLAHVREMSMVCCSTCASGGGAAIALLAFVFDIAFFFLARARINKVPGGSAQIGNGIWLTLAAWILLFFAGCFYGFGRCCIGQRPRGARDKPFTDGGESYKPTRADTARLDAVKAEADRKARQKQGEVGLPAFNEYQPLTAREEEENDAYTSYHSSSQHDTAYIPPNAPRRQGSNYSTPPGGAAGTTGYVPGAPGTTAMDSYYAPPHSTPSPAIPPTIYPPQPSQYYNLGANATAAGVAGAAGAAGAAYMHHQNMPSYRHDQDPSNGSHDAYTGYGHEPRGTTWHSAVSHPQEPSSYETQPSSYNAGSSAAYPSSGTLSPPFMSARNQEESSYNTQPVSQSHPLSMGRDDYTFSNTPHLAPPASTAAPSYHSHGAADPYMPYGASTGVSVPMQSMNNGTTPPSRQSPGPRGPRSPTSPTSPIGHPPSYEGGNQAGYDAHYWDQKR